MSTRTPRLALASLAIAACLGVSPALAFDGPQPEDQATLPIFKDAKAALKEGLEFMRTGHIGSAVPALRYAAESGDSLAQWKLGKMYASGDGVPRDDAKAFDYFSQIINGYDEDDADPRESSVVSSAFVALGSYNLNGVSNTRIIANPARALEMFRYAAVYFGDSAAQYNLGRMYLDGSGVPRDERQAARWLHLAADKGHVESQAALGELLFTGYRGMPPQRAKGLMWLSLADSRVTDKAKQRWIVDLYSRAMSEASDRERQVATAYLDDRTHRRN